MAGAVLTLTHASLTGLFYVQRYRFLTIAQFARLSGLSKHHAEDLLEPATCGVKVAWIWTALYM